MSKFIFKHQILVSDNPPEEEMFLHFIDDSVVLLSDKEEERSRFSVCGITVFSFTEEEYEYLNQPEGLIDCFNDRYGLMIDYCEEDIIPASKIPDAIGCTEAFLAKAQDDAGKESLRKVLEALEYAKEKKTYCEIITYLADIINE